MIVAVRREVVCKSSVNVVRLGITVIEFSAEFWKRPPQVAQRISILNDDEIWFHVLVPILARLNAQFRTTRAPSNEDLMLFRIRARSAASTGPSLPSSHSTIEAT